MKDLKFTPMSDEDLLNVFVSSHERIEGGYYLNVEWKGNKAWIVLTPKVGRDNIINGPMAAFFPEGSDRRWFEMRNEKIHRHAHKYIWDQVDVVIYYPEESQSRSNS